MNIIRFILSAIFNLFLGIVGPALLVSQLTGSDAVSVDGSNINVGFQLDAFGILAWVVLVFLYFFVAKKLLGKTVGGKLADIITFRKD